MVAVDSWWWWFGGDFVAGGVCVDGLVGMPWWWPTVVVAGSRDLVASNGREKEENRILERERL